MIFATVAAETAEGHILAHSLSLTDGVLKKGRKLSADDILRIQAAGVAQVTTVRLEADDVGEDEAARLIAQALCGEGLVQQSPFTGRVNVHAHAAGICLVDVERVNAVNRVNESITLATVPPYARLEAKQMAATFKIIPYAVKRSLLEQVIGAARGKPVIQAAPFKPHEIGLLITEVKGVKKSLADKAEEAMRNRVVSLGSKLTEVVRCPHDTASVMAAVQRLKATGCSPMLLFGASAIVDRGDVLPEALAAAGGEVLHLGMPVDPGNLLMLGRWGETDVIGVPSCARSPKINGFDWVLERILTGMAVTPGDVMDMGAGGLLAEISTRPTPREGRATPQRAPRVAAIVLAAGLSTRMGENKVLAEAGGKPLIAHVLAVLGKLELEEIIVVTGRDAEAVGKAARGARLVHNPLFAEGIATSVRAGMAALGKKTDAVLVCLADMPLVESASLGKLVEAFNPIEHRSICIPVHDGKRGNPVLWGRQHFAALSALTGDQGGRVLLDELADEIADVHVDGDGILRDADTPEALAAIRSALSP